ncbi:MAG TPA: hypothetical protein VF301_00600 [Ginsengibacter sp.]
MIITVSGKAINKESIAAHVDTLNKVVTTVTDKKQNKQAISLRSN